jgi:hypothetical protein
LIIHKNNENTPTFYTIRNETICQSARDLTLTNLNASTLINEWKLSLKESLSDHRLISFELNVKREPIKFKNTLKFNTKTADWIRFEELTRAESRQLKTRLNSIRSEYELNEFITKFEEKLKSICEQTMEKVFKL